MSAATVTQFDRVLAENGLRSKGGKGTSAAKINARDAANLLIAILGSPMEGAAIKSATQTCRAYASLPLLPRASSSQAFRQFGLWKLASLRKKHTLGDAIEALIAGAAIGHGFIIPNQDGARYCGRGSGHAIWDHIPVPTAGLRLKSTSTLSRALDRRLRALSIR